MSDFKVSVGQRQRLLAGNYAPLKFRLKPCEPGDRYVLQWQRPSATAYEDGFVVRIDRAPVWFLTVTRVERIARNDEEANWLVRFQVTDLRDGDRFLARGAGDGHGYTGGRDVLDAGPCPDADWLEQHAGMVASEWTRRRLERHAEELRARAQWKRARRAA